MRTTWLLLVMLVLLAVEISSKRSAKKQKQPKQKKIPWKLPKHLCSPRRRCPGKKFCIPFYSKCARRNKLFGKKCYIDADCRGGNENCSIALGFCFYKRPPCHHVGPYSFCRKGLCPCPDGYECKRRNSYPKCLPTEDGSGKAILN